MAESPHVFDVTVSTFERDVVLRSQQVPVLLDFWADWCGPCRTLGPVLAKVADAYGGAFVVGRVDTDREAELAAAFRVQGIPFCILLAGGRPVDGFQGAIGERELRAFLERCGVRPPQQEDAEEEDRDTPAARLRAGLAAAARGDAAAARERLGAIPEEDEHHGRAANVLAGLELFEAELAADTAAARPLERARQAILAGRPAEALPAVLESVGADKGYRDGLARRAAVMAIELLGAGDEHVEAVTDFRRHLATLLY